MSGNGFIVARQLRRNAGRKVDNFSPELSEIGEGFEISELPACG
jgi:hypothetical protein